MTFAQFRSLVLENLDVDANRRGTEVLRDRAIQNAMADLQRLIVPLRPVGGLQVSFVDADELVDGWDATAAECVAEYVKGRLVGRYDQDMGRANAHMTEYARLRGHIYRELRDAPTARNSRETTLSVRQGKTFTFDFEVNRSLAGAKIWFTVKPLDADGISDDLSPIYITTEVVDSGLTLTDAGAGKFRVKGTANLTAQVRYRWDVEVLFADLTREVPEGLHGPFVVIADPTFVEEAV